MSGWEKLSYALLLTIIVGSIELAGFWLVPWLPAFSIRSAGISVASFATGVIYYQVPPVRRRSGDQFLLIALVVAATWPIGSDFSLFSCIISLVYSLQFATAYWRWEIYIAYMQFQSKRSDQARRQHLRKVLKTIDAEVAKQREERMRVAVELEELEPKPTYRSAASQDT